MHIKFKVRKSLSSLLLGLSFSFFALNSAAQIEFWVSVGSFKNEAGAERALSKAGRTLAEPFAIIGTDTAKGYFYRVAAGPYTSRELAESQVLEARSVGFTGAWLWADEASVFSNVTGGLSDDADYSDNYSYDSQAYDNTDYSAADNYDPSAYEDYEPLPLDDVDSADDALLKERAIPDELVDEAPEGYKLNKLRRDARAQPPPEGFTTDTPPSDITITPNTGSPIPLLRFAEQNIDMTIDGNLDESVWGQFPGVSAFLVVDPDTGARPRYETLVKMFYTERGLYIAFEMEQPPETLVQRFSRRDDGGLNRDNVGITLDTSGEGRYGYWVNVALGGNQVDGTVLPERQFSRDWDGAWYGGTVATATGWNAEILLPWSQVAMPKEEGQRTIRAYASRKVAHLNERWGVPALPNTQPLFMSALQPLVLSEVDPQRQWSVFPYASVTQDQVEHFTKAQVGADVFLRPSTNFQLTATLNPDFGNVESDDVIVNLSAFETFFPEKRLFFQEGSEIFNATPRANTRGGNPTTLVNTRRIGGRSRAPDVPDGVDVPARELGQPTPLQGALKLVGSFGQMRYGLLAASEDETKFDVGDANYHQDGSEYGIARFLYEDKGVNGDYRAAGLLSTLVTHSVEDAQVHGVDYHYLTGSGTWKVDGQFVRSDVDAVGVGYGGFADVQYNLRRGISFKLGLSHFDERLDINDLGFLRRNDASAANLRMDYNRSNFAGLRKLSAKAFADYERNGEGEVTKRRLSGNMDLDLPSRDKVGFFLALDDEVSIDRASRGNGSFLMDERFDFKIYYRTNDAERFSVFVDANHGSEGIGGTRIGGQIGFNWRPMDQVNISARANYQRREGWLLWQEDRNFTAFETEEWRPKVNLDYYITSKQQLRFSAQWVGIKADDRDYFVVPSDLGELEEVGVADGRDDFTISRVNMQLRYRWEIAPLSDLFVVYTLNGSENSVDDGFTDMLSSAFEDPVGDQLIVKLRYRLGS